MPVIHFNEPVQAVIDPTGMYKQNNPTLLWKR